ncbi:hypothetical protein B9Z65_3691 [Elsinoe australis]|uniref:Uncharacterized protein n=1 Tax=Elsinoe australis TaxID=40998 RepID=A0A2P8AFZ2_9PEZI|nr:hypothetical protein B9Z65_3691 [Elsinoe australis]
MDLLCYLLVGLILFYLSPMSSILLLHQTCSLHEQAIKIVAFLATDFMDTIEYFVATPSVYFSPTCPSNGISVFNAIRNAKETIHHDTDRTSLVTTMLVLMIPVVLQRLLIALQQGSSAAALGRTLLGDTIAFLVALGNLYALARLLRSGHVYHETGSFRQTWLDLHPIYRGLLEHGLRWIAHVGRYADQLLLSLRIARLEQGLRDWIGLTR